MIIVWTLCAFVCGSLMFSYWLGRIARTNLKVVGDGNPGALNLWKAAGFRWGIMGIVLDFLKGYLILVLLLGSSRIEGYAMIPVALAPIVGHAFSPFLKGRGGKAIAVTFGVWSALSGFEVSLALAIILAVFLGVIKLINKGKPTSPVSDGTQVVIGLLLVGIYLPLRGFSGAVIWVWVGNLLLIAYTHRHELRASWRQLFNRTVKSMK
ncbi:glycerol-3-phosphate acyltransferase [Paenibacillus alba]|uniref:glycerol-3-phosphate acyltransferase n=1 Tax=Paenibacillus alba TaxID=1197127 RepID=UPI00156550B5|nr:glycerol-3-phosphate acyltransferase [Paenibacillus alba]NQX70278.1 glycerol-3-phosphate acyltransferase [Paenibacillus alba]